MKIFGECYGIKVLYIDGIEMMCKEKLDIVVICINMKGCAFFMVKVVEFGAKVIFIEKFMVYSFEEVDWMVKICVDCGILFCCGAIMMIYFLFVKVKELV